MDTELRPGSAQEDERGKQLAEGASERQQKPMDADGAKPLSNDESSKLAGIEKGLKDDKSSPELGVSKGGGIAGKIGGGAKSAGKLIGNNKKAAGGIATALILIVMLVVGIVGLLADKLASVVANIYHKEMAKVENSVKRRAEKQVLHLIYDKAAGNIAASDNPLVAKLYDRVPIDKITSRLTAAGVEIKAETVNGRRVIQVKLPNENKPRTFSSEADFAKFFGSNEAGIAARGLLDDSIESETKLLEVVQRHGLRKLMRDEFGADDKSSYDGKTGDEATKEVAAAEQEATIRPLEDTLGADVSCATGNTDSCPADENERKFPDGNTPGHPTYESTHGERDAAGPDQSQTSDHCSGLAGEAATKCASDNASAEPNDPDELNKGLEKKAAGAGDSAAAETLAKDVEEKLLKGAGVVGILDTLSGVDAVVQPNSSGHNAVGTMIIVRRERQYVGLINMIDKDDSDIRAGIATPDEAAATLKLLDGGVAKDGTKIKGIEGSQAFSAIFENDPTKGETIDPNKLVGSDGNSTNGGDILGQEYDETIGQVVHPVLAAWRSATTGILGFIGNVFSTIISHIPGLNTIVKSLADWLSRYAAQFINYILGTVLTGAEIGSPLMNGARAGQDVLANGYARDSLGAPAVSAVASAENSRQLALDDSRINATRPLTQRLFDKTDPTSLTNQLAARMPSSFSQGANQTGSYLASLMANPAKFLGSIVSGHLFASAFAGPDPGDPYGVQHYEYNEAQLDAPVNAFLPTSDNAGPPDPATGILTGPDGVIDQWDCPQKPDATVANECLLDVNTLEAMGAISNGDDNAGIDSP